MRDGCRVRVLPAVGVHRGVPRCRTAREDGRVVELRAVNPVLIDVNGDGVAVLYEGDRSAEQRFGSDVTNDEADGAPGESSVGHKGNRDAALTTNRGDLRGRVEHLGHSRCPTRSFVADDHHVVVVEVLGTLVQGRDQLSFAVEDPGAAGEDAVDNATLDAGQLQDGPALGCEVAP